MLQAKSKLVVHISDRVVTIVKEQEEAFSCQLCLELPQEADAWITAIAELPRLVKTVVEEIHCSGHPVRVLYLSPTATCQMQTFPLAQVSQAITAGKLSCASATSYGTDRSIHDAICVNNTQKAKRKPDANPGYDILSIADRDDVVHSITQAIIECGLNPTLVLPVTAALTHSIVSSVLRQKSTDVFARLHIGTTQSVLVIGSEGSIKVFRHVDLGVNQILETMCRPINSNDMDSEIVLTPHEAAQILLKVGIPDRDCVVDELRGIKGYHILPLIQPLLQRAVVELKQSIRFGISDEERSKLSIQLTGPGGRLHSIDQLLANSVELGFIQVHAISEADYIDPWIIDEDRSECEAYDSTAAQSQSLNLPLNLIPQDQVWEQSAAKLRKGMWIGAAAGLALSAAGASYFGGQIDQTALELKRVSSIQQETDAFQTQAVKVGQISIASKNLDDSVRSHIGLQPRWSVLLREIAQFTPQDIRITSFIGNMSGPESQNFGRVSIEAVAFGDIEQNHMVSRYVETLENSPLIANIKLGAVHHGMVNGRSTRRFSLSMTAIPVFHHTIADNAKLDNHAVGAKSNE